ncbi:MAG: family 20 glycosylhydrolase, partial [Dokdonella sp.]|uniref:family 20 glycosylhydrolase n=1 Tax=Dokdonella sp. TaxID=2291710 RepID=UPI003265832A
RAMDAVSARHVLGAQANLWTEHMRTTAMVEHAAFPRVAALAEVLWSPAQTHDWTGFVARLSAQLDRYTQRDVAAASSAFEVRFADAVDGSAGQVATTLSNQVDVPIHYTIDGGDPDARSPRFLAALQVPVGSVVRAAAFVNDRRVSAVSTHSLDAADLLRRSSDALKPCRGTLRLRLEDDAPMDGERAFFDVDLFDPCWIYEQAPLDGIAAISVTVGQVPYNFQLGKDAANIWPRPISRSPEGELQVKLDGCNGSVFSRLPLAPAIRSSGTTILDALIPAQSGRHDLCFVFAGTGLDPLWAIDTIRLVPKRP